MASPSLAALEIAFADEDTQTWTEAAREIGARAAKAPEALDFVRHWLGQSPADAADGEGNIHRFRHACCALASYLSEPAADREAVAEDFERHVRGPIVNLAFIGLRARGGTVEDLGRIPGLAATFEAWVQRQREVLGERIQKLEAKQNERGVAANREKLAALEALTPTSPVPDGFDPDLPGLLPQSPWALASFFSGVRAPSALGGVPLDLLVAGALDLAVERRGAGLPFVLNLPELLLSLRAAEPEASWSRLAREVAAAHEPTWVAERLHYNEWVREVSRLPGAAPALERFSRGLDLDRGLEARLEALASVKGRNGARETARLMRALAEDLATDDWAFEEKTRAERFGLNVFAMLAVHGPGPLFGRASEDGATPSVAHRVSLVLHAMQVAFRAREYVVPTLVRCLKLLLDEELRAAARRADLAEICRKQVDLVRPLVEEWRLPRTLRKDLAIIVCRVLLAAYRQDRATFVELLYHVLYALPDEVLFREIIEYSTEPEVSALLRRTAQVVEAAHADADADALLALYLDFATAVRAIAEGAERVVWTARLPELMRFLGRVEATGGPPPSTPGVESALQSILRCRGEGEADWAELASTGRGDKKGASWAARERARREEQASRQGLDRFSRLLDDVQVLESDCLPEVGRPKPSDDLARRWRRLIATLDELSALAAQSLPFLEREVGVALLEARIERLERRLAGLVHVLEREDEAVAVEALARRVQAAPPGDDDLGDEDARLVQEWMLGRYMIAELARVLRLQILQSLTTPWFVALWVLAPFVACAALHHLGFARLEAVPFAFATFVNAGVLAAYFTEARRSRGLVAGAGRYLLPQITAALFLGIMEVLAADEAWSLAVLEYGAVRLFTVFAFLGAGFLFIREVLLGDQLKGRAEARAKSRRAASVMSLILWQSFALVTLFGTLGGRVMGARAGLDIGALGGGFGLPHEVLLDLAGATFRIFPWALITWTVQVFFFSAIFERIMRAD